MKKTRSRKSRDTVPLRQNFISKISSLYCIFHVYLPFTNGKSLIGGCFSRGQILGRNCVDKRFRVFVHAIHSLAGFYSPHHPLEQKWFETGFLCKH
jgi:hypothetical protein